MVNFNVFIEDEDFDVQDDQESQSEYLTPGGRRDTLRRVFGDYQDTSSSDEEGLGGQCSVIDEQASLSGRSGLRVPQDIPEMRPQFPPGPVVPYGSQPAEPRGKTLYSRRGVNPIEFIRDPRKRQASEEVLDAFLGPPKKRDPNHLKLRETGWEIAQRVFHPLDVCLTKDANAFMTKNLTLISE